MTGAEKTAKEAKLPSWVRDELRRLRRDLEDYKRQAFQAANTAGTDTFVEVMGPGAEREERGLPNGTHVYFRVGPARRYAAAWTTATYG